MIGGKATFGWDTASDEGECNLSIGPDETEVEGQLEGCCAYTCLVVDICR